MRNMGQWLQSGVDPGQAGTGKLTRPVLPVRPALTGGRRNKWQPTRLYMSMRRYGNLLDTSNRSMVHWESGDQRYWSGGALAPLMSLARSQRGVLSHHRGTVLSRSPQPGLSTNKPDRSDGFGLRGTDVDGKSTNLVNATPLTRSH
jgi:hypothetical protein